MSDQSVNSFNWKVLKTFEMMSDGQLEIAFYIDNCKTVYGDAQAVLIKMIEAVYGLGLAAAA